MHKKYLFEIIYIRYLFCIKRKKNVKIKNGKNCAHK